MRRVICTDQYQKNYSYICSEPIGKNFDKEFKPELTPQEMLELGVFGGNYFFGGGDEFPSLWFEHGNAKRNSTDTSDPHKNFFGVLASQSLSVWQKKGWIYPDDPRGWFEWYCRYYMGRRIPDEDRRQIRRWKAISRHVVQITRNCRPADLGCRPRQRQAVLQWAYDSRKL